MSSQIAEVDNCAVIENDTNRPKDYEATNGCDQRDITIVGRGSNSTNSQLNEHVELPQTQEIHSVSRTQSSPSKSDPYLVSRDAEESARLDTQHKLVVGAIGYHLHPHIVEHTFGEEMRLHLARSTATREYSADVDAPPSVTNEPVAKPAMRTIRIADIATGTGVWLFDLERQLAGLPTTTKLDLHGFDMSAAQFPKGYDQQSDSSGHIKFHVQNAKQSYPAAMCGTFDVVHIRYVYMGMENAEDWETVARHAITLLKPGGALQWTEPNIVNASIRWCRSDIPTNVFSDKVEADEDDYDAGVSFMNKHFRTWVSLFKHRLNNGWDTLLDTYRQLGLEQIIEDVVRSDRVAEYRQKSVYNTIDAWKHVMAAIAASGDGYMSEEELAHIICKMRKYASMGTYSTYDIHTLVGYKPR